MEVVPVMPQRVSAIIEQDPAGAIGGGLRVRDGSLRVDGKQGDWTDHPWQEMSTSAETMGGMDMVLPETPYHVEYFLCDEGPYGVFRGSKSSYPVLIYTDGCGRVETMPCCFLPLAWNQQSVGRSAIRLSSILYPIIAEREGRK